MRKRILSMCLVVAMALGLLAGCGKQSNKQAYDDNYRNYYEIFVYSFYDSDGDGIGDFNGVTEKLDYIQDMGFNGIWLMPIMKSTTYHKYDVVDYYDVDPEYGTMEDFEKLVKACHEKDIDLTIDFEMNHSSSQNEWFKEACEYLKTLAPEEEPDSEECPYVDYYHFTKDKVNDTYYQVAGTNWYYEGGFWSEMPDMNLENEKVKAQFQDIAKSWIDKGIDGFRMDAVLHFEENDTSFNIQAMKEYYDYCKSLKSDFYMVSEAWADEATIKEYYGSETPSMFNFDAGGPEGYLLKVTKGTYQADNFVDRMIKYQEDFSSENPDYIDAPFITNHDMGRACNSLVHDLDKMKMEVGLLMTMSGNPFIYYGEEIGMSSKGTKDENKRLPMVWANNDDEGMTDGPQDADSDIEFHFDGVKEQLKDKDSLLNYYKRAIALRNENPEMARGIITKVDDLCDGSQAALTKTYKDSTIGIVYNTSEEEITVDITGSELENMKVKGSLTLDGSKIDLKKGTLTMPARSICILK